MLSIKGVICFLVNSLIYNEVQKCLALTAETKVTWPLFLERRLLPHFQQSNYVFKRKWDKGRYHRMLSGDQKFRGTFQGVTLEVALLIDYSLLKSGLFLDNALIGKQQINHAHLPLLCAHWVTLSMRLPMFALELYLLGISSMHPWEISLGSDISAALALVKLHSEQWDVLEDFLEMFISDNYFNW